MKIKEKALLGIAMVAALGFATQADAKKKAKMTNYLFAYFTGNAPQEEQIHFAVSDDGSFYMVVTDMRVPACSRLSPVAGA